MFIASSFKIRNKDRGGITNITYKMSEFIQNCAYNTKPCFLERDFRQKVHIPNPASLTSATSATLALSPSLAPKLT